MRIQLLGSAAAEAVPAFFCECETCAYARQHGGKDIRRRTAYLIDDDTLIDFGPDCNWQINEFHINLLKVKRIIFTHAHSDHLDPIELYWRTGGFCKISQTIKIMADTAVHERLEQDTHNTYEGMKLEKILLQPGAVCTDDSMTILPIRAAHDPASKPLNFIISRNGKHILIANDTGWWPEESWDILKKCGLHLDVAVIEACAAFLPDWKDFHLSANTCVEVRDELKKIGLIDDKTICISNHYSHNGNPIHEKLQAYFDPFGILSGYDGLCVEF